VRSQFLCLLLCLPPQITAAMLETRTSSVLQTFSHALVVGAGLVYLFGFIIVSINDASYGIADFGLFRTKVIAVGTLFVLLLSLPMLLTFRIFSLFGLTVESADISWLVATPANRSYVIAVVALSIPFASFGLAFPLVFLFNTFPEWKGMGFGLFILTGALLITLRVFAKKWFNVHPLLFVLLCFLDTAALFLILFEFADRQIFWFVVWLSLACLFTLQISLKILRRDEARKTEWERLFLTIIPVVFFVYADKVYPNIKHQYGGGAPVPVVLHLTKKLPIFDSESVPFALIDETEQGYYVVRGSDKAVFIARGLVEEVEFLRPASSTDTKVKKP
jgi:hypothetical protein